jgi:hypothetical protein
MGNWAKRCNGMENLFVETINEGSVEIGRHHYWRVCFNAYLTYYKKSEIMLARECVKSRLPYSHLLLIQTSKSNWIQNRNNCKIGRNSLENGQTHVIPSKKVVLSTRHSKKFQDLHSHSVRIIVWLDSCLGLRFSHLRILFWHHNRE